MASARSTCPVCRWSAVQKLETISKDADVDYFICTSCMQVWNIPKGQSGPVQHVTDPNRPRAAKPIAS